MILTIDIGTSNFKTAIYDFEGNRRVFSSLPLKIEGDPKQWVTAYNYCREQLGSVEKINAIVITGNGPTLVPVFNDNTAGEAKLWLDSSAIDYQEEVSKVMGGFVDAKFFLPKIMKMKNEDYAAYNRTRHFLGCPEYLAYLLTGEAKTVFPTDGFERWFWNDDSLDKLGLDKSKFPEFIRPGNIFGYKGKIPVISGGPDFFTAILGAGITQPGQLLDRTGSSEGVNLCTHNNNTDSRFMSYGHPIKPYWNMSQIIKASGIRIKNVCNSLGLNNIDDFIAIAERGQTHAISILQNLCQDVDHIIRMMEETGEKITEVRVTGGLSANGYFNQMKANILEKIIIEFEHKEADLLGCAIIGSVFLGKYADYKEACEKMIKVKKVYIPVS